MRSKTQTSDAEAAFALCARHLRSGALADASRAALLAQRLIVLETAQADLRRKRELKAAAERRRAEATLEQARKAVASLSAERAPPVPNHGVVHADKDWRDILRRVLADTDANTQRSGANAEIGSGPEQKPPPDSC